MATQSGHLETMTPEERTVMLQVKAFLKETYGIDCKKVWNHWFILRFCRARKFVLNDIVIMIKDYMNWCGEMEMHKIGELDMAQFDLLKKSYDHGYYNTDRMGRPVYIEHVKHMNADAIFGNYSDLLLQKYYVQSYERLLHIVFPECSRVAGRRIDRTCGIIELKDVNVLKLFTGKIKAFLNIALNIGQKYYPETMDIMFILHAGLLFSGIWAVVKHLLDVRTQKKINIISGNGRDQLVKVIAPENLPPFLGGTCTNALTDDHGPWHDELLKSHKNKTVYHSDPKLVQHYFWDAEEKEEERKRNEAASMGQPVQHLESIYQKEEEARQPYPQQHQETGASNPKDAPNHPDATD